VRILERLRKLIVRTLINLAYEDVVGELYSSILEVIVKASPEEIWAAATNNVKLIDQLNSSWNKRINTLMRIIKVKKLKDIVLELLDKITVGDVLAQLYNSACKLEEDDRSRALRNLHFIASSPTCMKWLRDNIASIKEFIRGKLEAD